MMSDLPLDLEEEILSRVPATSFKRLRSTCRRWDALLKDQKFTEKHSRKAPKESMVLMLKEYRVCPISVNLNVTPPSIEFKGALGYSHSSSEQVEITEVIHCDGLLLCTTNDNRLLVWNPCLGETKCIQLKVDYGRNYSSFALGYIQNNESCRSYKILWSWSSKDYESSPPERGLGFEIYEFSSDSWRVLDDINHDSLVKHNSVLGSGVSLKGNTYLFAYDVEENSRFLLMFDFTTERLKRLCLPHFQDVGHMVLSVVREEHLSILHWTRTTSKMEIWITNNIDTDATLLWRLHLHTRCNCVRIFSSLLIDEEKKVVLCCNVNDDETSKNMDIT
ncbi:hypothetical protein ARALYDRAFT_898748 [Arabidopsis lyrata subsp. lyrata]|uniref:F-box domain-containing protein n=1 Tax=Arabidopsis lyrata subsp. lyrata TaxID=81972 RepID=D7L2E8_ARALL|nr:hypothetical protein ARALYDRAFT_898748 [Arabidopsis lyrata subsp. lyrata]